MQFQRQLGPISNKDFMNYAKRKVNGAFLKVEKLFNQDDYVALTNRALSGCKVFDILILKTKPSIVDLKLMIDDLTYFTFPEFTDEFLNNMKDELPSLLNLATSYEFDFDVGI